MRLKLLRNTERALAALARRSAFQWTGMLAFASSVLFVLVWAWAWHQLGPAPPGEHRVLAGLATDAAWDVVTFAGASVLAYLQPIWLTWCMFCAAVLLAIAFQRPLSEFVALTRGAYGTDVRIVVGSGQLAEQFAEVLAAHHPVVAMPPSRLQMPVKEDAPIRRRAYQNACALYLIDPVAEVNLQAARAVSRDRDTRWRSAERLFVRAESRALRAGASRWLPGSTPTGVPRSEFVFSMTSAIARQAMRLRPLQRLARQRPGEPFVVVLLGDTELVHESLVYVARAAPGLHGLPRLVLACASPGELLATIEHNSPALRSFLDLDTVPCDPGLPESAGLLLERIARSHAVPMVYVLSFRLPGRARRWRRRILAAHLSAGFDAPAFEEFSECRLSEDFEPTDPAEDVSILTEDDSIAMRAHATYRAELRAQGIAPGSKPADCDWHSLAFDLKEENRAQVDHWWAKARDLNCLIVQQQSMPRFVLDTEVVAKLAEVEHLRWCISRALNGWVPAVRRDDGLRRHPLLVPWTELDESQQRLDEAAVAGMPAALATQGLALQPLSHRLFDSAQECGSAASADAPAAAALLEVVDRDSLVKARDLARSGMKISLWITGRHGVWADPSDAEDVALLDWSYAEAFRMIFTGATDRATAETWAHQVLKPGGSI